MITKKDVEYIAALSKLNFSEEEKEKLTEQLSLILEFINSLNELDTEGVKPTYQVMPIPGILRQDEVSTSLDTEKVLMNAASTQENLFKVPKII